MFKGSITAMVTPMREDSVDEDALRSFIDWQIAEGTHGLVPVGTTGESPTLSHAEHKRVVEVTIEVAAGREKAGADAVLVVTPYYNKPNQEGLYQHYKAINDAIGIPIIIYNIPPRSIIDMSVETMARLFELKNIIGVKDATAKLDRVSLQRHAMGPEFLQLSGEDGTALGFMAHGGHGCISVASNVAPRLCAEFQEACMAGDFAKALAYQDRLMPLHSAIFVEPNPTGVKYALSLLGRMEDRVRLPLVGITESTKTIIRSAMAHAGLVN
ncbi:MAG: 4-hydroxy-tetrahydrodipicolinate synthase [Rhizobiales bacterium]|nr:4-hydroxy-tetrahydrodipicolinate synthase [Hyphomicrobiales bacterium]